MDVVSGLTIPSVGRFLGVIDIVLVVGSTLIDGVEFSGELASFFSFGAVISVVTLGSPLVFTLGGLDVLGCTFLSCLGMSLISFLFLIIFIGFD